MALLGAGMMLTQACNKSDTAGSTTTQTVSATVEKNGTYSYTLPAIAGKSRYTISTQASHAASSSLTTNSSGASIYTYTPATDYTGADAVVVSGAAASGNHSGGCGGNGGDNSQVITFRLTVSDSGSGAGN